MNFLTKNPNLKKKIFFGGWWGGGGVGEKWGVGGGGARVNEFLLLRIKI